MAGLGGLIPALAGTTRSSAIPGRSTRAHPRAGGDDAGTESVWAKVPGSSPRWRGRPHQGARAGRLLRLIPALAGTTADPIPRASASPALPRAGGDDRALESTRRVVRGSFPRWRGRPCSPSSRRRPRGLIPALAGTTPTRICPTGPGQAHPRAGGDDIFGGTLAERIGGSSPRWRGRPERVAAWELRDAGSSPRWRGRPPTPWHSPSAEGLIPALAGTTVTSGKTTWSRLAHPRAGGDDLEGSVGGLRHEGSSPRWRGRQRLRDQVEPPPGLIPALAGTTTRRASASP